MQEPHRGSQLGHGGTSLIVRRRRTSTENVASAPKFVSDALFRQLALDQAARVLQNSENCENATLGMASDIAKFLFEAQA